MSKSSATPSVIIGEKNGEGKPSISQEDSVEGATGSVDMLIPPSRGDINGFGLP